MILLVILPPELNWSTIEVCSLVICACIPSFRAFLRLFPCVSRFFDLSTNQSKFSAGQRGSSYRLESRNQRTKTDTFSRSKTLATTAGSADNESQVEILQEDGKDGGKDGIKVTTDVRVDRVNRDRNSEPSFVFNNNV
jgi:hypothetical protein